MQHNDLEKPMECRNEKDVIKESLDAGDTGRSSWRGFLMLLYGAFRKSSAQAKIRTERLLPLTLCSFV